ncbi:Melanoma-associated antigen F1 [Gryganskiella cystojenkinii]|nr:Melanoma-associated antigen F1 [Gryganskiella cystojenkinii]
MIERRRRIAIDDDEAYGGGSSSSQGQRKRPSQGQSSGSQKRVMREDDSDQGSDVHVPAAKQPTIRGATAAVGVPPEDMERLIKDVVRLAIFTAHSETSLKREDIKNVMGNHGRALDHVFNKAQERLRDVFGMEMAELTTRGRDGRSEEKGTKTYMLRNVLPINLLETTIIDWEPELEDMGLLMVILSLIMVREGTLQESVLLSHLRRMALLEDASNFGDIHKKLDEFIKKRYLDRYKLEHMDDSGEKIEMEYRWGARARVEIPEENVVKFIQEVFGREAPQNLVTQIKKAAGMESSKGKENESASAAE